MKAIAEFIRHEGYSGQVSLVAEFKDALGNAYKTKPSPFDPEVWSK